MKQTITSLTRGLSILSIFENLNGLSHKEICEATNLPKATVTRLLYTLVTEGFLIKNSKDLYMKGIKIQKLSWQQDSRLLLLLPLLKKFAETTQASVNLAICQGDTMFYVACYQSNDEISVNFHEGTIVPIEVTALGRAYYARASKEDRSSIRYYLRERLGDKFPHAEELLKKSDQFYLQNGYAFSDGEFSEDILAAAFAIEPIDELMGCFYSINASVPRKIWDKTKFIQVVIPALKELSITISLILK